MILLGIDIGTSSIKVSVVDSQSGKTLASAQYPEKESEIITLHPGWAEQSPEIWWDHVKQAILICHAQKRYNPADISSIGIAYQMHGLVMVDKEGNSLRNSIIWCDSRAIETGNRAFDFIGHSFALTHLLNSPGNFTASKLGWVKENEPHIYNRIYKIMLPGDFIAMKLTGEITSSIQAMSEGIFWDFKNNRISDEVMKHFGFDHSILPEIKNAFSNHGSLQDKVADFLSLPKGIPISYKAGDQPNNALSLNVTEPGEVAATAGTSGVIYAVSDRLVSDINSRVNTFAHVNHTHQVKRLGVLLCINGTGSMNRWTKNLIGNSMNYAAMNEAAASVNPGSDGIKVLPFGNGAERMFENKIIGAHFHNIDLNLHTGAHIFRAVQEGIAYAFRYGFEILKENGVRPLIIRAGMSNLFLSEIFTQTFVNICGVPIELYDNDGSYGAAVGAGIGAGVYSSASDAFQNKQPKRLVNPDSRNLETDYEEWCALLDKQLSHTDNHKLIEH